MFELEKLTAVEQTFGFKYPPSFYSKAKELAILSKKKEFQIIFPKSTLVESISEIQKIYAKGLPISLIPFMLEERPLYLDFYVFDISSKGPELSVAVFSDHATVHNWLSYSAFLAWVYQKCGIAYQT